MDDVDDVVTKCELNDTCGALGDQTAAQTTWFGMTSPSTWPETISDDFYTEFPDNNQVGKSKGGVRACVCACVCVRVRACGCVCVCVCV